MRYLIIGLGIYGSNLATDLSNMGHEVVAVDSDPVKVEEIKDNVSNVYIADTTEQSSIDILPLSNVDLCIVAIGENFGASVKTVALLKKAGMAHIYARAIDKLHEAILKGLEVERVLTPEQRAAADLVHEMSLGARVQTLAIDPEHVVVKFRVSTKLEGNEYSDLKLLEKFGLKLLAVTRVEEKRNILGIKESTDRLIDLSSGHGHERVEPGDTLTVFGAKKSFEAFYRTEL